MHPTPGPDAAPAPLAPLGAVLAGGASRRFGSPKALATVGGRSIAERVLDALRGAVDDVALIANQPELFAHLGVSVHRDIRPGQGPLGGIRTALVRATERRPGALCVACDVPFASAALLRLILDHAAAHPGRIVMPESRGRRGVEPLCAFYPHACLPLVRRMLVTGERKVYALADRAITHRVPLAEVEAVGDPDVLFFNVNTTDDLRRAEEIAADR